MKTAKNFIIGILSIFIAILIIVYALGFYLLWYSIKNANMKTFIGGLFVCLFNLVMIAITLELVAPQILTTIKVFFVSL